MYVEEKKLLRKKAKELRSQLSKDEKAIYDKQIFNNIVKSNKFTESQLIFIYVSYNYEVDTIELIEYAIKNKKRIAVPKIISMKDGMVAIEIRSIADLKENSLGILEPVDFNHQVDVSEIDLCIVPGLAFDRQGGRVGYGGGFYDRFLGKLNKSAHVVAVAYDFQIVDKVPCEQYDIKIEEIVTN